MNYINQLQANKAAALDSARSIETEINDLLSYLCCDKFSGRYTYRPLFGNHYLVGSS
jgi:hypothetical protein